MQPFYKTEKNNTQTVKLTGENIKIYCLPRKMASNMQTNSNRDFHQKKRKLL